MYLKINVRNKHKTSTLAKQQVEPRLQVPIFQALAMRRKLTGGVPPGLANMPQTTPQLF